LLLTPTAALATITVNEISRVLPAGGRIYILGGDNAISPAVETQLPGMGYEVTRLAGIDRYATAVAVADVMGDPTTVFEADGTNFPDALSAGSAAGQTHGAILLTAGTKLPGATSAYLAAHPGSTRYAIGGPAAQADPGAQAFVGVDRYATSIMVATQFFPTPTSIGFASGSTFPDALSGGVVASLNDGPMVLVPGNGAMPATALAYLAAASPTVTAAWLFGGIPSVAGGIFTQISDTLSSPAP
ncbi:MAG: cell wall-binding repeat-containing protein, partial [Acidothermaceae bacterium]